MSLITGSKENIKFSYQLPLRFDDQLGMISQLQLCVDMETKLFNLYKVWNIIKKGVVIEVDGVDVWIKGELQDEKLSGKMLGYSFIVSDLYVDKFMVFIREQGVDL